MSYVPIMVLLLLGLAGCGGGGNANVAPVLPSPAPAISDPVDPAVTLAAPLVTPQVLLILDGFSGFEASIAFMVGAGLRDVQGVCDGYDPCRGQHTVLPPNMRVVQLAPSTTETIDGHPCFDSRPYGMTEFEYQERLRQRGYGCAWGYASIQDWAIYMTPHVLPDGSLDPEHVAKLTLHETRHLVGAWNHPAVLCYESVPESTLKVPVKIWLKFGHGGECDLTGGP